MSVKAIDVLVFLPLVPAVPAMITWFLPWEDWVTIVPKYVLGPYLLYCSFAAWYFASPWWLVTLIFLWGAVVSGFAIAERYSKQTGR